jgi:hypothetical protein
MKLPKIGARFGARAGTGIRPGGAKARQVFLRLLGAVLAFRVTADVREGETDSI